MIRVVLRIAVRTVFVFVLFVGLTLAFLTLTEYRPDDIEEIDINNNQTSIVKTGESISLMTFNIGYAGLGKDEDFVLDGGTKGRADSIDVVEGYLDGILDILEANPVDIYLLQEVDLRARRSFNINQVETIENHLGPTFNASYALNFDAVFVPFPVSMDFIGPVQSGLQTLSNYNVETVERYQFPGNFSWPLRIANLKRTMTVSTYPIEDSEQVLIVINLHMSAYDEDGSLREQEMAFLKTFIEEEYAKGNYVIAGGDFNQTFPSVEDLYPPIQDYYIAHPIEDDFLSDDFSFVIDELTPTCRLLNQPYNPGDDATQYYIIDGFIVSNNVRVDFVQTIDHGFLYSDHNPVLLEVTLLE